MNIALLHESQENNEAAIEYLEKAQAIDPENVKIQEKIQKLKGGKVAPFHSGDGVPKLEKNRTSELTIGSGRKGSIKGKELDEEALMVGVQEERVDRGEELEVEEQKKAAIMDSVISRASILGSRVKVYDDIEINSPRAKTETASNFDKLDQEEHERLTEGGKGTIESGKAESEGIDEKELEQWQQWDKAKAEEMAKKASHEVQKRAHYRLGVISQAEESWAPSLVNFNKVIGLDPEFFKS